MRSACHQGTVAVYNEKQSFLYAVLRVYHNFFCPVTPWHPEREQVSGGGVGTGSRHIKWIHSMLTYSVGPIELLVQPENGQLESISGCGGTYDS